MAEEPKFDELAFYKDSDSFAWVPNTAEAFQTQHSNEKPWTTQQNATQPAPEQSMESTPVSAVVYAAPAPPSSEEMANNPTEDYAAKILVADTTLDDETRANVWDAYHNSRSLEDLVRNLSPLEIPDITRQTLLAAKSVTAPAVTQVEKVANALHQMSQMNPALLDMAEKYKHVAKMMIDAAVKSDEE
jgi:hypothetical protein